MASDVRAEPEARFWFPSSATPILDPDGFLDELQAEVAVTNKEAIRSTDLHRSSRAMLLLGPPYSGKSWELERLRTQLSAFRRENSKVHVTDLRAAHGPEGLLPSFWSQWRQSKDELFWFIDALDDGEARTFGLGRRLLKELGDLAPSERNRVRLLITCREGEVPPGFDADLSRVMNLDDPTVAWRLAPLTLRQARILIGEDALSRARDLIQRKDLGSVPLFPDQLKELSRRDDSEEVSPLDLWKSVIAYQLGTGSPRERLTPVSTRFQAAQRIALILTFGAATEISDQRQIRTGPSLDEVFHEAPDLIRAAEEAKRSALFRATPTGFRFHHRHLQEQLCALELAAHAAKGAGQNVRTLLGGVDGLTESRVMLAGTLAPLVDGELRAWLDRALQRRASAIVTGLLNAAGASPARLYTMDFERLFTGPAGAGIAPELDRRLEDWTSAAEPQKLLLLEIARAVRSKRGLETAETVFPNAEESEEVRREALRTVAGTSTASTEALLRNVEEQERQHGSALWAETILYLMKRGLWSVRDLLRVLPAGTTSRSHVASLYVEAQERLTAQNALVVLESFPRSHDEYWGERLFEHAVELLVAHPDAASPSPDEISRVLRRIAGTKYEDRTLDVLEKCSPLIAANRAARRLTYESETSTEKSYLRFLALRAMDSEDLPWLLARVTPLNEDTAIDALRAANFVSPEAYATMRDELRSRVPDLIARFEAPNPELERYKRISEKREKERASRIVQLEPTLRELLAQTDDAVQERLWKIGLLCFAPLGLGPRDVEGSFDALPSELKRSALVRTAELLREASPTAFEPGSSFPTSVAFESGAFRAVVEAAIEGFLDAEQVRKWLPAVLKLENAPGDVLDACMTYAPAATVEAVTESVRREGRVREDGALLLHRLPSSVWDAGFSEKAIHLGEDPSLTAASRAQLLVEASLHAPADALALARTWLSPANDRGELRVAALKVLMLTNPDEGVTSVENDVRGGRINLEAIAGAFDWAARPRITPAQWSLNARERFATLLLEQLPEDRVQRDTRWVTPRDQLFDVRRELLTAFYERRGDREVAAVLSRLSAISPAVKRRFEHLNAEDAAASVLTRTRAGDADNAGAPRNWPLEELHALIRSSDYRLARTPEELWRVVLEFLSGLRVEEDLALLYDAGFEQHHSEDVFQAYLRRRLHDALPGRVIHREGWVPLNRSVDFAVHTRGHAGADIAVPVEVKWSDNQHDPYEAVSTQLGDAYLKRNGRTHGVFLVAWCGKGAAHKGHGRRPRTAAEMELWLNEEARRFEAENPHLHIAVTMIQAVGKIAPQRRRRPASTARKVKASARSKLRPRDRKS